MQKKSSLVLLIWLVFLLLPSTGRGAPIKNEIINIKLHDVELLNQDGKRLRFKSEAIADKLVIISFTYSTCTLRPVIDEITTGIQTKLSSRLGREVEMISISIDPVTDIPQRLKQYAQAVGAKPGWIFLTGKKVDVDRVLVGLDSYAANISSHPLSLLVGDGRRGTWKRIFGFPSPEAVLKVVKELEDARH